MNINTNKKLLYLLSFLLLAIRLSAQNKLVLHGLVKDGRTNLPVEGATILVKGLNKGTSTNAQGSFEIRGLSKGSYAVVASFVGYGTKELLVDITEGRTHIDIILFQESKVCNF